ncbi:MAG: N-acetylmuramoyl-L-alanine amidase [Psychroserpens sp.]|nr:N-acetylmuramoyl-L-alanine amidase [Psychroserpens sp.]
MKTNLHIAIVWVALIFTSFLTYGKTENSAKKKQFVVVLDAGHGGKDSGTPGTKRYRTTEKDIALDVTLALGKLIKEKLPHVKVIYTRTKDVYPTLMRRAVIANDEKADLFISVHCNAQPGGKGTAYGSETFVLGLHKNDANLEVAKRENSVIYLEENYEETYKGFDPTSPESIISLMIMQEEYLDHSIELASLIETEFKVTGKRKSRGVKQAGLYVLAYTYMPSVLVELGFLTNKKEEDYLNSKKGKQVMTQSLFTAVKKYIDMKLQDNAGTFIAEEIPENSENVSENDLEPKVYEDVIFKVQIAASSRDLEPKSYNFNGLSEISKQKVGSLYKYYFGSTSDLNEIRKKEVIAKEKGYSSSFVVAFKDGEQIKLSEVLKTTAN